MFLLAFDELPLSICVRFADWLNARFAWDRPYVVDGGKFVHRFGFMPTPFEVAVPETVRAFAKAGMQAAP